MDFLAERGAFDGIYEGDVDERLELGFVKYSRGLGRKRIVGPEVSPSDCGFDTPLKRQCSSQRFFLDFDKSDLESLPIDVLIRILCFVDHEDLKQLFKVSKTIREASTIAEQWHFAYATPRKVPAFRNSIDFDASRDLEEIEPPNAPLRFFRKREIRKNLTDVVTVLFAEAEI
ncbi:hypothetical protein MLD38_027516 [Melastoma candidum]|uniref:Uncharacterized protein n=1 Tax=Melastoma candidum TaxID=119954 RepID=A0ACB9P1T3_9MYRT|nr:hypothetical protein MLD38_027516 [Melastoma candidum]